MKFKRKVEDIIDAIPISWILTGHPSLPDWIPKMAVFPNHITIQTSEGTKFAAKNDWLLRRHGYIYPLSEKLFEELYEEA